MRQLVIFGRMEQHIIRGGARIGAKKISRPFAQLTVTPGKLELNASIIGRMVFLPEDIIAIHPYAVGAIFGKGLTIVHKVGQYNREIIFWCSEDREELIADIIATLEKAPADTIALREAVRSEQMSGSFPLKTGAAVSVLALWNIPLIITLVAGVSTGNLHYIGFGVLISGIGITGLCLLLLFSQTIQRLFLKKGRTIEDVRNFLYFLMILIVVITAVASCCLLLQ
jgi:hypothetical protein